MITRRLKGVVEMELIAEELRLRGVELQDIARIVLELQKPYNPKLELHDCLEAVQQVFKKRDVQYAVLTGIALDKMAEEGLLPEPLQTIIATDEPLYGLDEVLAYGITNIYGSIGITSFGYLDKIKPGVIGILNDNKVNKVNTFLDDIVAGITAAACAKLAHATTDSLLSRKSTGPA
ncbi:phosphatidylglycerophosphatase A family protein [Zhaonella formicivorans]|jgi:phosphatidylglycerophosphatase A|uniref:phosphatidylglycerophosphatase A family protein n=1 Tax=Zhaonella formicivorans TaxID=2528593 RepID=UPI00241459AC|nr:phosphatidylglycerophosphatase A [Zhaonella formicivorans]